MRAKRASGLAGLAIVLGWIVSPGLAGDVSMRFSDERDAGLHQHSAERNSNAGGAEAVRIGKGGPGLPSSQEMVVYDWDTAAITTWIAMEVVNQGWTNVPEARSNGAITVTFEVTAPSSSGDYPNKMVTLQTVWSSNDWTEGDGLNDFINYNWTTPSAATFRRAQDRIPDSSGAVPWHDPVNDVDTYFRSLPGTMNSVNMVGIYGSPDPGNLVWNSVRLDEAVWADLIYGENPGGYPVVGLATGGGGWQSAYPTQDDNVNVHLREHWGGAGAPSLLVTVSEKNPWPGCIQMLARIATNWGKDPATWEEGDLNNDTIINVQDLAILATNWSSWDSSQADGGTIPEPAALSLLAIGGGALIGRRRRR